MSFPSTTKIKTRRITQACDFCHRRGLRCRSSTARVGGSDSADPDNTAITPCLTCTEYGQECTRTRQPKKRGTKPRSKINSTSLQASISTQNNDFSGIESMRGQCHGTISSDKVIITALINVYLDSIHPTFPVFCERELWVGWQEGSFPGDASDYMALMCMCALSAEHVANGAVFSDIISASECDNLPVFYLDEAIRLVPTDFAACDQNLIRSYSLLALLAVQKGDSAMLHKYLGLYHGLCAHTSFQDEARWTAGMSDCEREVGRRLWWVMYRLEVHTSCVLGNPMRCSETQCNVGYPSGTHHPAFTPGRDGDFEDWFAGWNTVNDLFRVLEHVIADFRTKTRPNTSILGPKDQGDDGSSRSRVVLDRLAQIQKELLPHFGTASTRSDDSGRNRCGFQASNILCTIHLARLLSSISSSEGFQQACKTARDMIESMRSIPIEYIRALGSPLIQQLAGAGHALGAAATKQQIPHRHYSLVIQTLQSIIEFLEPLKKNSTFASSGQMRLVTRLEEVKTRAASSSQQEAPVGGDGDMLDSGQMQAWLHYLESELPEPVIGLDGLSADLLESFTRAYPTFHEM